MFRKQSVSFKDGGGQGTAFLDHYFKNAFGKLALFELKLYKMLQAIVNNKTNKPRRHTVSVAIVGKTVIHLLANVVMFAIKML